MTDRKKLDLLMSQYAPRKLTTKSPEIRYSHPRIALHDHADFNLFFSLID